MLSFVIKHFIQKVIESVSLTAKIFAVILSFLFVMIKPIVVDQLPTLLVVVIIGSFVEVAVLVAVIAELKICRFKNSANLSYIS